MAIASLVDIIETAVWQQGDARDSLGNWAFRLIVAGDATGGSIKVTAQVPADKTGAYIYTAYGLTIAQTVGSPASPAGKSRLLTNWPDADADAGVQAYATARFTSFLNSSNFTAPFGGPDVPLLFPTDRFILLYDPRPLAAALNLIELEVSTNGVGISFAFEGWGYFWDRGVLNAPGGPRHPGSN